MLIAQMHVELPATSALAVVECADLNCLHCSYLSVYAMIYAENLLLSASYDCVLDLVV